jgi:hypothetical protein
VQTLPQPVLLQLSDLKAEVAPGVKPAEDGDFLTGQPCEDASVARVSDTCSFRLISSHSLSGTSRQVEAAFVKQALRVLLQMRHVDVDRA